MDKVLKQANGKPWITDKGETVPSKCPKCNGKIGLHFYGEPVFICEKEPKHYCETMKTEIVF